MDTPRSRKDISHDRILEVASQAIRSQGFQGVGVAAIMKEAGLTHGGFYAHFGSRDALLVEAMEHAGAGTASRLQQDMALRQAQGASLLRALVESYLSERHLAGKASGCAVAALVSEMPRQSPEVAQASAQRVRALVAAVRRCLPKGAAPGSAPAIACQLVGTLQMARALGDLTEGRALLKASRRALLAQYDHSPAD